MLRICLICWMMFEKRRRDAQEMTSIDSACRIAIVFHRFFFLLLLLLPSARHATLIHSSFSRRKVKNIKFNRNKTNKNWVNVADWWYRSNEWRMKIVMCRQDKTKQNIAVVLTNQFEFHIQYLQKLIDQYLVLIQIDDKWAEITRFML